MAFFLLAQLFLWFEDSETDLLVLLVLAREVPCPASQSGLEGLACLEEKPLLQISQEKGARVGSMHGLDKFCCRSFGSRVWEDKIFCTEIFTFPFGLAWSLTIASVFWRLASNDGGVEDPGIMQSAPKCALLWNRSLYFPSPIPPMASEILFPLWRGGGGVLKALDNEAPGIMLAALPDKDRNACW